MDENKMDIPPLLCFCGRYLSTEKLLGHYLKEFVPSLNTKKPEEVSQKTKQYFINELNLHSSCCWNKMHTVYDPIKICLANR